MRFGDSLDPQKGPEALTRFALLPLLILLMGSLAVTILGRLSSTDFWLAMLFIVLASPLAYLIREARLRHRREPRTRRGAERTPLLPQDAEDE